MAFINVYVSRQCHISVKHNSLYLEADSSAIYPLEDVNVVMIDSYCTITAQCISRLAQYGAVVYTCDDKHMPCAITLPYSAHYRRLHVLRSQLDISVPTAKQLWQSIIRAKLANSATCLNLCGKDGSIISSMISHVSSGDKGNVEASAALKYFTALCGSGFTRNTPCMFNSCIDYTYAVVRAMIARSIVVHGLEPSVGIHHCSTVNVYNLADDLIEPYRAIVDYYVYSTVNTDSMSPHVRAHLLSIANVDVSIAGQIHPLSHSIELYVQSFVRAMTDSSQILLPQLIGGIEHIYE